MLGMLYELCAPWRCLVSDKFKFSARSKVRLLGVRPDLILVVSRGLLYSSIDFAITEGLRGLERQKMLLETGKSRTLRSSHLRQPDGFAHAIDVMAVGDLDRDGDIDAQDKNITWNREWYGSISDAMYKAARELDISIRWGGAFKSFYDGPHFELL